MKVKIKSLIELLNSLDPKEFLLFIENFEKENGFNPFLHKHFYERLHQEPLTYINDEPSCDSFFKKHREIFEVLDSCSNEARQTLGNYYKILYMLYESIQKENIIEYQNKIERLEKLGISTIIFGFNHYDRKHTPIISSKGLKTFIKIEKDKPSSVLTIYSDGNLKNTKLCMKKDQKTKYLGCIFDLENPTFIIESSKQNSYSANLIYVLGSEISNETIEKFYEPNIVYFNEEIQNLDSSITFNHDYELTLDYSKIDGQKTLKLYN